MYTRHPYSSLAASPPFGTPGKFKDLSLLGLESVGAFLFLGPAAEAGGVGVLAAEGGVLPRGAAERCALQPFFGGAAEGGAEACGSEAEAAVGRFFVAPP